MYETPGQHDRSACSQGQIGPAIPHRISEDGSSPSGSGSHVSGSALVSAKKDGTRVTLTLYRLAPKAIVRATLHAGTCAKPSASFAATVSTKATAAGSASATARAVFHGKPVSFIDIADGEHAITISAGSRVVACGAIPVMH